MIDVSLTNEQAKWLKEHLDTMLDDTHWGRSWLCKDEDAKEHAQTIHDKIDEQLKSREW